VLELELDRAGEGDTEEWLSGTWVRFSILEWVWCMREREREVDEEEEEEEEEEGERQTVGEGERE
jgi:hypothetical protein